MADTKITALTALTAADPANDVIPIVDVSDTSMAASGTTKKISVNNILGASGTATLASATITGAATVTGAANLNGAVNLSTSGTPTVTLGSTSTYGLLQGGGTNASSIYLNGATRSGVPAYAFYAAAEHQFYNNTLGTQFATLNTTALTIGNGNLVIGTSGKGIDFSAVTGGTGTATANVLNDYEEGTFTPTVIGGTIAGVGVYGVQIGRYTKVGNLVNVQVYLDWSAHTGTGEMSFGNFPFTTNSTAGTYSSAAIGYSNNIALTASNILTGWSNVSATSIRAYQTPVGGGAATAVPIDTSGEIMFSITYRV